MKIKLLYCFMAMIGAVGCDNAPDGAPVASSTADAVVGAAADNLDRSGHFVVPTPALRYPSIQSIDSTQARDLAATFVKQFWDAEGAALSATWARQHGAPIARPGPVACGPMRFVASPVAASVDQLDHSQRRNVSERWILRFCIGANETAGYVGVSVYASDIHIDGGRIVWPLIVGGEFQDSGLPITFQEAVLYTPETAVVMAFECSRERVQGVPRLVGQYGAGSFQAKWQLVLEHPAVFHTSDGLVRTDTVYAGISRITGRDGYHFGLVVGGPDQPTTIAIPTMVNLPPSMGPIPPDYSPQQVLVNVLRDPTIPLSWRAVSCARGGQS